MAVRITQSTARAWALLVALTVGLIVLVNPASLLGYGYFLGLAGAGILLCDRAETSRFLTAFLVNALLTACYVLVQSWACPESYGTTTPGGSQTDDSYFFSQVAAQIPPGLPTRENYELSSSGFTTLVKHLTFHRVLHPLDVLFFLSIVAGLVCCYARKLALLLTGNRRAARRVYLLCLFCPLLLMNGGAVFVRDSFVAGLFMLSLYALLRKKFLLFAGCMLLQLYLRPGTALILLPLHGFLFLPELKRLMMRAQLGRGLIFGMVLGLIALAGLVVFHEELLLLLEQNEISLTSFKRTGAGIEEYIAQGRSDGAFATIQRAPFLLRGVLSMLFMWLVPFFHPGGTWGVVGFDARNLLLCVVYPLWIVWTHSMVFALIWSPARKQQAGPLLIFIFACFLIGMVSLESRHRTIVQPLYYILAAAGAGLASSREKLAGWAIAITWLLVQILYYFSHAS